MITEINTGADALKALQENFSLVATKKRTPNISKEINSTIGKMIVYNMTLLKQNMFLGVREKVAWLTEKEPVIKIEDKPKMIPQRKKTA